MTSSEDRLCFTAFCDTVYSALKEFAGRNGGVCENFHVQEIPYGYQIRAEFGGGQLTASAYAFLDNNRLDEVRGAFERSGRDGLAFLRELDVVDGRIRFARVPPQ